jgi:hypothetical protein
MKLLTALLIATVAIAIPAEAKPSRDLGPLNELTWTAQKMKIVLTRLNLNRPQREKVMEVIDDARKDARDIERNRRLSWIQRQDRLLDVSTELRGRIIHVLTGGQKVRLQGILNGDRNDGPRYRPNEDRRDPRSRPEDDRGIRSRDTAPRDRTRDDQQDHTDWPWQ